MKHELQPLPYTYDALEPYIDARTMEIHHTKHHQNYINKLNETLETHPELYEQPIDELLKDISKIPEDIRIAVINNGGGHYNHQLFWRSLCVPQQSVLTGILEQEIIHTFDSVDSFWQQFTALALSQFGSGWVWLVITPEKKLTILKTGNQDSPISQGNTVLLGIDVWEHAYYLKYQNRRVEYIEAWKHVVNWDYAREIYEAIFTSSS
ncbi:MAG: superoxide dismutase [Candidatus Paceibacterota bacterium]